MRDRMHRMALLSVRISGYDLARGVNVMEAIRNEWRRIVLAMRPDLEDDENLVRNVDISARRHATIGDFAVYDIEIWEL